MKKLIFLLFIIPFCVRAQNLLQLKGNIENLSTDKNIYLITYSGNQQKIDTAKIINGKFEFSVALQEPTLAFLLLDHTGDALTARNSPKDVYRLFLAPGNAFISAKDSIAKAEATGLEIFNEQKKFASAIKQNFVDLENLNKEFSALPEPKREDEQVVKSFQKRYQDFVAAKKITVAEFIKANPASYVSLYALSGELATEDMDWQLVEETYKSLDPTLQQTFIGKNILEKYSLAKKFGIGATLPDFEQKTAEQIPVKLSSFKGQYVLVDFWASWCGPCRKENPTVLKAYETYKNKNFTVLGVSIDTKEDAWVKAYKADGLVWTQLLDRDQAISTEFGITSIPRNFLLNPEGKIIAKNLRGEDLLATLAEVLKNVKAKN